jgi:GMP synthase-like glutamine amidotransferase
MRVLVVQNFDDTLLGQVGVALEEAGAEIDVRTAHRGGLLPQTAEEHDALVVLGGGQNALDDANYPYIPALLELMRSYVEAEKSVLGICLGSQLLARAYGGKNQIGGAEEFGWCRVALAPEAASDPVLGGVPEEFPIFQWHDDTFSLPDGAVRLAGSAVANNQAFRVGRAGYGIQFHFEADRTLVRHWNETFAQMIANRHPEWIAAFVDEAARHGPVADAIGLALARAWVATIHPAGANAAPPVSKLVVSTGF